MFNLPPEMLAGASALFMATKGLALEELTADHIGQAAKLLGHEATPQSTAAILKLASAADPKMSLIDWAKARMTDGTFEGVFRAAKPKALLYRCDFCAQPNTVATDELPAGAASVLHRCQFCNQPNTVAL